MSSTGGKAFKTAFVDEFSTWSAKRMVIFENAAGAWVFEVAFVYALGDVFFAVGSYAVVGGSAGGCETESCRGDIALSSL